MYDIHSHIIFGIDDGSPDEETTRQLLTLAAQTGTTHLVATPHIIEVYKHPTWKDINTRLEALRKLCKEQNLNLQLYAGAEIMLTLDILSIYDECPRAFCINNTQYTLIELPMLEVPRYTEEVLYHLQLKGLTPILAHPERYVALFEGNNSLKRLLDWCNKGILLQINGGSLLGKFGTRAKENAEFLLKNKLISFIGSDAHRIKLRNTDLSKEREILEQLCGKNYCNEICYSNPQAMLSGKPIHMDIPQKLINPREKPSLWKRIFG